MTNDEDEEDEDESDRRGREEQALRTVTRECSRQRKDDRKKKAVKA